MPKTIVAVASDERADLSVQTPGARDALRVWRSPQRTTRLSRCSSRRNLMDRGSRRLSAPAELAVACWF